MDKLLFQGPVTSAPGFVVEHYETLDSTNTRAAQRATEGYGGNLWVRSDVQEQGKARRGRSWTSEKGNLFASVLLRFEAFDENVIQMPFVAALALAEAVEAATGTLKLVELKWPNDLLVDGAKISGILLESATGTDGSLYVVCGFGVNCVHHPDLGLYKTTDLRSLGYGCEVDQVFTHLASRLAYWLEQWRGTGGFELVRREWLSRAVGRGKEIRVRLTHEEFKGTFVDIDHLGRLIVKRENGREQLVTAGDVFFS
ncbi:biotin--[acetyl-CoA-carboxylase] ligase [Flexibacterium corallicola]|uniref:biotin--[acetyl-CoA-carboxylase] ligase n=1 Tax=Flexibacterium corallicola TaxID=3037259 RepID=UPI00286FA140|nr:biotin--[acetyl-CoA-carboxylase] ligase [Pseudovibrio sp. M1P-2-3]